MSTATQLIPLMLLVMCAIPAEAAGPAARAGDPTTHGGVITEGSTNVLIGGGQASRAGDFATCPLFNGGIPHIGGDISTGSGSVLINGLPAARVGDAIVENGAVSNVLQGSPTVTIGN